jgi:hypothetical protein
MTPNPTCPAQHRRSFRCHSFPWACSYRAIGNTGRGAFVVTGARHCPLGKVRPCLEHGELFRSATQVRFSESVLDLSPKQVSHTVLTSVLRGIGRTHPQLDYVTLEVRNVTVALGALPLRTPIC